MGGAAWQAGSLRLPRESLKLVKYPRFFPIRGQNFKIFSFLELKIFLFDVKDLIRCSCGGRGVLLKSFVGVFSAMPKPPAGRACSGQGRGPVSLSCHLLAARCPHPRSRPSSPSPSSPRLPARRAKGSEGTGRPVTPGLARAESRWPCGSVRSQGIPVLGFSIPWPEAAPQTKATEHGVAGQPPGACLPLPRP